MKTSVFLVVTALTASMLVATSGTVFSDPAVPASPPAAVAPAIATPSPTTPPVATPTPVVVPPTVTLPTAPLLPPGKQMKLMTAAMNASKAIVFSARFNFSSAMATAVGAGSSVTGSCDGTTDRAGHFIVTVDSGGKGTENIFFDGKNVTAFNTATSQYCTLPASTGMQGSVQPLIQTAMTVFTKDSKSFMLLPLSLILPQLYSQGHYLDNSANLTSKYGVLEGQAVINVSQINSMGQMKSNLTFSIDPTTNLLAGIGMEVDTAPGKVAIAWSEDFTSLRPIVNVAAVPSFVFVAPVGSTKVAAIQEPSAPPSKLLAVGKPAPNFSVMAADGSLVKLSKYAGKVVVLDFWATWCGPCQASLPHTDAIAKVYLRKGVVFLPICSWDDKSAFTTWRKAHSAMAMKFYYDPAGQNGTASVASKLYGVDGIPTQYVIGKHGKVAASFVGYDEQGDPNENSLKNALNAALAKP